MVRFRYTNQYHHQYGGISDNKIEEPQADLSSESPLIEGLQMTPSPEEVIARSAFYDPEGRFLM